MSTLLIEVTFHDRHATPEPGLHSNTFSIIFGHTLSFARHTHNKTQAALSNYPRSNFQHLNAGASLMLRIKDSLV